MSEFTKGNFVGLHRGEQADFLQRNHPAAFLLLCLIARRARYHEDPCPITGLRFGEAFIGDWKEAGLTSRKQYRCALERLKALQLCGFRGAKTGANKGTVATLMPQGVFSISVAEGAFKGAAQGPPRGHEGATEGPQTTRNKETRNKEQGNHPPNPPKGGGEEKATSYPDLPEFESYLLEALPKINPDWTPERIKRAAALQYETFTENRWRDGNGKVVKNWKTKSRNVMIHKKPWSFGSDSGHRVKPATQEGNFEDLIGGRKASITKASDLPDEDNLEPDLSNEYDW